jgi:hypothetical protein
MVKFHGGIMKTKRVARIVVLLSLVCSFPVLCVAAEIPADAVRLHDRISGRIQPSVHSWIRQEANKFRGQSVVDEKRLRADIAARFEGQNPSSMSGVDIEAVAFIVMMQATKDADSDLKALMEQTKAQNESRRKARVSATSVKNMQSPAGQRQPATKMGGPTAPVVTRTAPDNTGRNPDSMDEMDEPARMRLQALMDKRSKTIDTLTRIMKKVSDTQGGLIQNLK